MGSGQTSYEFELTGGALCLDFTNTLGDRPRSTEEHLGDYGDLLSFSRFVTGEMPEAKEIQSLNAVLQESLGRLQLRVQGTTLDWVWDDSTLSLERPTWPIVRSAAELLTSGEVSCVRECASETCSWLFIDRSRTKRRRWCDMSTCGNRAKARRHYQRQKKTRVSGWTSPREGRSDSGQ